MDSNDVKPSSPVSESDVPATPITQRPEIPTASPPITGNNGKKIFGKIGIVPAAIAAGLVLIGGTAAAYFGVVVPNQPENVWKTALNNTAKGYDKLVDYVGDQKDVKGGKVKGTFKFESAEFVVDGSVDGRYDEKTADIKLDAGAAGTRVNFNILTNIPESATTPDIYLKADGLSGLGALLGAGDPTAAQYFASLDGKYYFIDHTLLDQFAKSMESEASSVPDLTPEDIKAIAEAVGSVNKEYLFTTDKNKAVMEVKSEVGKENFEGRSTYHYKVGYHKDHLKEYITKQKEALKQTKLKDLIQDDAFDQIVRDIDSMDGSGEADVWVDMKTKLIRTVRFSEEGNDKSYADLGLLYEKGDEYPFYFTTKDESNSMTIKLILNIKTNTVKLTVDGNFDEGGNSSKITADINFESSNDKVEFNKPEGAESLGDLLAPFFGGLSGAGALDQSSFSEEDFTSGFNLE